MARPMISPRRMQQRRDRAIYLLENGASSIRAVAEAVGAHPSSVHKWKREMRADGSAPPVIFARRHREGVKWSKREALEAKAQRTARKSQGSEPAHPPAVRSDNDCGTATSDDAPRHTRTRCRRLGARLREQLGLPEVAAVRGEEVIPDVHADSVPWATPLLRRRIEVLLEFNAATGGLTTDQVRVRLGAAYADDSDADFAGVFEEAMRRYGFARRSDGRWSLPISV